MGNTPIPIDLFRGNFSYPCPKLLSWWMTLGLGWEEGKAGKKADYVVAVPHPGCTPSTVGDDCWSTCFGLHPRSSLPPAAESA